MEIDTPTVPGRVVVGVDGSWNALGAVGWAAAEARLRGAALHILYAVPGVRDGTARVQDVLDRAFRTAREAEPELMVTAAHVDDAAGPALLDAADRADLLVVGMAERDRTEELLLGSVALHVSGRASSPVVVVRGERRLPGGDGPVLVGVDAADVDGPALAVAFDEARRHGSGLVVLHVRRHAGPGRGENGAAGDDAAHVAAWNGLCDALAPWAVRYSDVSVDVQVVRGDPTGAILAAAVAARIVVVGSRGRSAPRRALFGSTSREVLRRCPVPVVVVSPAAGRRTEGPVVAAGPALPIGQASARAERDHPHDPDRLW